MNESDVTERGRKKEREMQVGYTIRYNSLAVSVSLICDLIQFFWISRWARNDEISQGKKVWVYRPRKEEIFHWIRFESLVFTFLTQNLQMRLIQSY